MKSNFNFTNPKQWLRFGLFVSALGIITFLFAVHFNKQLSSFGKEVYYLVIVFEFIKSNVEIALLIIGILNWGTIKKIFNNLLSKNFLGTGENFDDISQKVRGIIIPVSRRQQPEWIIRHLKPEYVAFLYTERSKKDALELTLEFGNKVHFIHTAKEIEAGIDMIKNPNDPLEVKQLTKKFISKLLKLDIDKRNIFVDTTGGKVPMSIGAFQAAEESGVSSLYIIGTNQDIISDPTVKEQGKPIFLSRKD